MNPRLSVIIPTHNRASLLHEAISSVIRQGITPCEIIVCDDGSSENIKAVCKSFENRDGYDVLFSRSEKSKGAPSARNKGLKMAKGEMLMFLDSDDAILDGGILPLVEALEKDEALDYVHALTTKTDPNLKPLTELKPVGSDFEETPESVAGYHWNVMGILYRRSFLGKVGQWNKKLTGSQDWEYQARVKIAQGKRKFIDTKVAYWRLHESERIGNSGFRPDYVKSVMIACDSILKKAKSANYCNAALEKRIAKRLVVHALEWGTNGYTSERKLCLRQAASVISQSGFFKSFLSLASHTPSLLDFVFWKILRKQRR